MTRRTLLSPSDRIRSALCAAGMVACVVLAWLLILAMKAEAHEAPSGLWSYPPACCSGNAATGDCQQIPMTSVKQRPDGFHIVLNPGDHRLITGRTEIVVPYGRQQPSPDGAFHICTRPSEPFWRCFFAPDGGV